MSIVEAKNRLEWTAQLVGIWYTVLIILVLTLVHVVMFVYTFFYYELDMIGAAFIAVYFGFAGWLLSAFIIGFMKLAVKLELTDTELIAKGLFGQRWVIPLEEIDSFRDADIFVRRREKFIFQIGVLRGGMKSFAEVIQEQTPQDLLIENEELIKQGRW